MGASRASSKQNDRYGIKDDAPAMEHKARFALFHQSQQFQHAVRERQRIASFAVSQAVLEPSARFGTPMIFELKEAQCNNQSTMHQRGRDILFRLGNEAQDALRQERMVHEQNQFVQKGEAQINFVRHQLESEQRAPMWVLEAVSPDRDIVRRAAPNSGDIQQRSESAAQLSWGEDQTLSHQLKEARESCEYLSQSEREELVLF